MLDDAIHVFTRTFYSELLSGKAVGDAYRQAVASVKFIEQKREGDMFLLLTQDGYQPKKGLLNLPNLFTSQPKWTFKIESGVYACVSDHVLVKQVPTTMPKFSFREKPISKLVQSVMDGERLVVLLGVQGLNKSAVARFAIHYMLERKYFTGGAI